MNKSNDKILSKIEINNLKTRLCQIVLHLGKLSYQNNIIMLCNF